MSRRNVILAIAGVLMLGLVVALLVRATSGPPADRLIVAGDVRVDSRTVVAPAIATPTPDFTVGIPAPAGDTAAPGAGSAKSKAPSQPTRSGQPVVSGRLTRVNVRAGDTVKAGQVIAQLDTAMLDLGVKQAKANAVRARTTVRVLKNNLNTVLDNIDKIATGRTQISTARVQLARGKAQLRAAKAQLLAAQAPLLQAKRNRRQLEAQLAALRQQAAQFPPGQAPPALLRRIGQLQGLLAAINPGLAKIAAGLKQVAAGEAQLAAAQAQLNAASSQLNTAADALSTAKKQITNARDTLTIVADSQQVAIDLAEAKRDQATIHSPVNGVVTFAVPAGTVAMVGSPIVRIKPDEPARVDTYLTPEQLALVKVGSAADVTYDSAPGKVVHGKVAVIGTTAQYPPTSFPTDIVHMTRTVKVTIGLDSGDAPPQGTPVDISIHTN
jgi:HlyD family secretion protein